MKEERFVYVLIRLACLFNWFNFGNQRLSPMLIETLFGFEISWLTVGYVQSSVSSLDFCDLIFLRGLTGGGFRWMDCRSIGKGSATGATATWAVSASSVTSSPSIRSPSSWACKLHNSWSKQVGLRHSVCKLLTLFTYFERIVEILWIAVQSTTDDGLHHHRFHFLHFPQVFPPLLPPWRRRYPVLTTWIGKVCLLKPPLLRNLKRIPDDLPCSKSIPGRTLRLDHRLLLLTKVSTSMLTAGRGIWSVTVALDRHKPMDDGQRFAQLFGCLFQAHPAECAGSVLLAEQVLTVGSATNCTRFWWNLWGRRHTCITHYWKSRS